MADARILEIKAPEEDCSLEVFDSVAEQAAEQLGYKLLKEKRDQLASRNRLVQALAKLNIPVYDRGSVERYKAATLKEARRNLWRREWRIIRWPLGVCSLTALWAFVGFMSHREVFAGLMIVSMLACIATVTTAMCTRDEVRKIEWRKQFVSQHNTSEIPTFVLARALELRCECPGVNFEIESIMAEKIDPFLVAEAGGEHFYIAYWNEPGFKAEEMKL